MGEVGVPRWAQLRRGGRGHPRRAAWVGAAWQEACREASLRGAAPVGETSLAAGGLGKRDGENSVKHKNQTNQNPKNPPRQSGRRRKHQQPQEP